MNSYIANSRIATGLRDGSITAIMVRCKLKPLDGFELKDISDKVGKPCWESRKGTEYEVPYYNAPYALCKEVYVERQ